MSNTLFLIHEEKSIQDTVQIITVESLCAEFGTKIIAHNA